MKISRNTFTKLFRESSYQATIFRQLPSILRQDVTPEVPGTCYMGLRHSFAFLRTVASSFAVLADRERLQAGRCFPMCLSVAGSRFTALWVALTGRVPGAQWTRLYSVDETIFMCGIYDYQARRVLLAV